MAAKKSSIDLKLIRDLADLLNETDLTEIEVEEDEIRIRLARGGVAYAPPMMAPAQMQVAATPAAASVAQGEAAAAPVEAKGTPVPSPMVGTAYSAPAPGADDFVKVGDSVKVGQTIMIVEAMKTMNQIPSTKDGVVASINVENGQPVEYGQTLITLQ